jgi:hypothetical protein
MQRAEKQGALQGMNSGMRLGLVGLTLLAGLIGFVSFGVSELVTQPYLDSSDSPSAYPLFVYLVWAGPVLSFGGLILGWGAILGLKRPVLGMKLIGFPVLAWVLGVVALGLLAMLAQ